MPSLSLSMESFDIEGQYKSEASPTKNDEPEIQGKAFNGSHNLRDY